MYLILNNDFNVNVCLISLLVLIFKNIEKKKN